MQAAESTWHANHLFTSKLRNLGNNDTSGKQVHVSIRLASLVKFLRSWYCSFIEEIFSSYCKE